jgi:hypothetical protein
MQLKHSKCYSNIFLFCNQPIPHVCSIIWKISVSSQTKMSIIPDAHMESRTGFDPGYACLHV